MNHDHDSYEKQLSRRESVKRTLDAFEGKQALYATWENCCNKDPDYMKELKKRTHDLRQRLRYKLYDLPGTDSTNQINTERKKRQCCLK